MVKFLCDQMCAKLGHWLRAAGYDTLIIQNSEIDQKIFQKAVTEQRILLTRDKHFQNLDKEHSIVILLHSDSLDLCAQQLKEADLNWLYQPFSRCLHCNTTLQETSEPLTEVPENIRQTIRQFWYCPNCQKTFWLGSHTDHMLKQLKKWQEG